MNQHVSEWIPAFYDGELRGARLRQVEEHLRECRACQSELAQLRQLSSLLGAWAQAPASEPDLHAAQVVSRLPAPAWKPTRAGMLRIGWLAAPLALVCGWAFFQVILIIATLAKLAGIELAIAGVQPPGFLVFFSLLPALINPVPWGALALPIERLGLEVAWLQLLPIQVGLTALVGVLLWGWLAGWWVYQRRLFQPVSNERGVHNGSL